MGEKVKEFVKKHKNAIVITAGGILFISGITIIKNKSYIKGFKNGFNVARIISFEDTLQWMDEHIPESKAMALYKTWSEEHPDLIRTWNIAKKHGKLIAEKI